MLKFPISTRLTPLFLAWKIKFGLKIQPNAWGNDWILYHKTNKEASTVLCSVVKHLGSGRALKKWGKTLDFVSCFPLHFFRALPLPACFTTEQSTVEASLLVKCYTSPFHSSTNNKTYHAHSWLHLTIQFRVQRYINRRTITTEEL